MSESYNNYLELERLHAQVKLGVEADERETAQPVEVGLRIYFPEPQRQSSDDDTSDFFCYDKIARQIKALCEAKEYKLVEYLGMEIYHATRPSIPAEAKIWLKVHKVRVLAPYVLGGGSFVYTDLPAGSWVIPN